MSHDWSRLTRQLRQEIAATRDRLEELEAAYAALTPLAGKQPPVNAAVASKAPAAEAAGASRRRRRKVQKAKASALPKTDKSLWLAALGSEKSTGREIVDRALAMLGVGEEAREPIYTRAANWFDGAVKKGTVVVVEQREGVNVYQRVDLAKSPET